jgi:heat shock protein HslJ
LIPLSQGEGLVQAGGAYAFAPEYPLRALAPAKRLNCLFLNNVKQSIDFKSMKTTIYLSLCLATLFAGCKTQKTLVSFSDLEGEWNVIELNGRNLLPEETKQRLIFDTAGHRLSGNAGCNRISGNIEYGETQTNALKFQGVIATRKACLDMRLEDEFLKTLDSVATFDTEDRSKPVEAISFYGADKRKLFVVSRRQP